jgi:coatomer subunit beta
MSTSARTDSGSFTYVHDDSQDAVTPQDLRAALERGTDEVKLDTLRRIISEPSYA